MSKLKQVLAIAASLVIAGATIGIALNQAGQSVDMTTKEWCAAIGKVRDVQRQETFFLALQPGNDIPQAATDGEAERVLGECSGGECVIAPDAAPECAYTYNYTIGPAVDGWRLARVRAHPYVAKGWKIAATNRAWMKWFGSWAEVIDACQAHTTGAKCLQLLEADQHCWRLADDRVCRYGSLLGSAEEDGTPTPCPYAQVAGGFPCVVYRGAGSERTDALREWTDEAMDEL